MPLPERVDVLLARPCPYDLPDDLAFVGLVRPRRKETIRLRFARKRGTTLDLPLSAEALADLVQEIGLLHGSSASEMAAELADQEQKGLRILER